MRPIVFLFLALAFTSPAVAQDGPTSAKPATVKSPLSPDESLKHLVLADPNLVIEIAAAEPEVIDPVSIQFDEHGRMWVVEMRDYPTGPQNAPPPLGGPEAKPLSRIKLLEDKDGDGRFETAHVFADNLLFATGVQPWDGGVIVTLAGEVAYFKDTDGDHKADVRETWFTGFAQANPQLRANHPTFGPDGWIYVANGLRGGNVIAVKKDWGRAEGRGLRGESEDKNKDADSGPRPSALSPQPAPVSLTGRDFKFDPLTGRYEAISGNGQFGLTFDAWGNRFVCDNRHPCRHVIFEEDFIRRCPHVAFPAVVHDVIPPDDKNKVFPLTSAWTTSNLHAGTFTAACGVCVYTGDWLPEEFRGNVFVCEPTGNLVQRAILEPDGVTFKSRNPYAKQTGDVSSPSQTNDQRETPTDRDKLGGLTPLARQETQEFLASRDDWFRPVDLQNGPDGALYVVDMYRAVIEHPEWVPDELKNRPDTWLGNDKGRIYRIRPKGERHSFDPKSLGNLRQANRWAVMTALRLRLHDKNSPHRQLDDLAVCEVAYGSRMLAEMQWVLANKNTLTDDDLENRSRWLPWHMPDAEPRVRFVALQATRGMNADLSRSVRSFSSVAASLAKDPWMRQATLAVVSDQAGPVLREVLRHAKDFNEWDREGLSELVAGLSDQIAARGSDDELKLLVPQLCLSVRSGPEAEVALSGLLALAQSWSKRGKSFHRLRDILDEATRVRLKEVGQACGTLSKADASSTTARKLAIRWLRYVESDGAELRQLMETLTDQSLRLTALESLASIQKPEVDAWLVERYRSETPAIRRAILAALFASKERQLRLLEAIEQGRIAATELDPVRVNQLTQAKDETLRERAKTVLAAAAPASRHEVLDAYRPALALTADPKRGREVFVKNCSTCHRVDNVGVNVAPDISDTRTKKPEQLLLDILDPNKAIDANYFAYAVVMKDGRAESGVIASESSNSITLKLPEGKTLTILRSDIEELRNTGLSLMPVGLEKNIDKQQMADLIFWLKNWRYLDGKVPATSLK